MKGVGQLVLDPPQFNMESPVCPREVRAQSRQTSRNKVASQSSMSSVHSQASSPRHTSSAVFSSIATPGTPTSSSHPSHRYLHQNGSKNSVDSKGSKSASNKAPGGDDARLAATPMSNILQERLQRERLLESTWSRRPSADAGMSASVGDLRDRDIRDSPILRSSTTVGERTVSEGAADQSEHKGFGVKEMDKVCMTTRMSPGR